MPLKFRSILLSIIVFFGCVNILADVPRLFGPPKVNTPKANDPTSANTPIVPQTNPDNEAANKFFKDASYENFQEQKEYKLFDESYLESQK